MLPHAHDHRLVQTAVVGDRDSDHAVILPMDAHELDLWRAKHPGYRYRCGLELGGCGGELSDKRYTDKVCHFAHHPDAPVCHRVAKGESSADHLFIKRGMRRLMEEQGIRGDVQTRHLGTGPGDAVDIHLSELGRRIRFQLSPLDHRAWRDADEELTTGSYGVDWVFGPDVIITREFLGAGYCLRVGCETQGGERLVRIGAATDTRSPDWTSLDECVLSPSGITSSQVEEIRISAPRPQPAAFPVQGTLLFALQPEKRVQTDSPFAVEGRRLVIADVKPTEGPLVRAVLSLPADAQLPPAEHVYQVRGAARLLVQPDGQGWAVQADRFVRLDAHQAERSGLRLSSRLTGSTVEEKRRGSGKTGEAPTSAPPAAKTSSGNAPKESAPAASAAQHPPARPWGDLVVATRESLVQHARLRTTTTWAALIRIVGEELGELTMRQRDKLLVEVDAPLREDTPVLSALIRDGGAPPLYLPTVLDLLGVPHAAQSSHIKRWAAVETERAYAAHANPPRRMRERLVLSPGVERRRAGQALMEGSQDVSSQRMHDLIAQLEELRPRMFKATLKRTNTAVERAKLWLAAHDDSTSRRRLRRAGKVPSAQRCIADLENALHEAEDQKRATAWLDTYERSRRSEAKPNEASAARKAAPGAKPRKEEKPQSTPVERLARQLVEVALGQKTISVLDLEGGRSRPDRVIRERLSEVDRGVPDDVPILSALVTDSEGDRPVPFFRMVLKDTGFAVPQTDQALLKVWRREQERAHAAYANPPRPLPPRLVPKA